MKVKDLIGYLQEVDQEFDVDLSRFFIVPSDEKDNDCYEVILDCPIVGLATGKDHVRFMLDKDGKDFEKFMTENFGEVWKVE